MRQFKTKRVARSRKYGPMKMWSDMEEGDKFIAKFTGTSEVNGSMTYNFELEECNFDFTDREGNVIEVGKGDPFSVFTVKALVNAFADASAEEGDTTLVEYTGMKKSKAGQSFHSFYVEVEGAPVEEEDI